MAKILSPAFQPPATPRTDFGAKVKAHIRYRVADGTQVPGVTTIVDVLDKPALVTWANRLGLQGIDSSKYSDEAKAIGTLAHHLIQCELGGTAPELRKYTPDQLVWANRALTGYRAWREQHDLRAHYVEEPLVSEQYRYGGTIDCAGWLNGKRALVDFKTSSGIWPEHKTQVAAYRQLLREAGHRIDEVRIVRIDRNDGALEERVLSPGDLDNHWEIFKHCLGIYQLRKRRGYTD